MILGRDFSIQNCIGISWTKANTCQLTQNNKVIAETEEYQPASRATVSLKKNVKIPPHSCAVVDVDINSTDEVKVKIVPDELWLSANPNICTYPMIADLKDRKPDTVTPFVIVNFSHHEYLHLPKDHIVAFAEKDCNEGEVLEICTMEELERDLPRNWIPECKQQETMTELFKNPFIKKKDDFMKSPVEAPAHRKVLLKHIQYLSHLISAEGIQPLPEKLENIAKMPAPKNPKEVKQFLGLVGYYRKFVPRFVDISRVLTHLTKKDVEFRWTPKCENCFQILKDFLQKAPILKYPDPQANYTLYIDASKYTYTSVLTQHSDGTDHPIIWATLTKEAYAIYMSVKKLSFYINTAKVTVKSGHLPLKKFLEKNTMNSKVNNLAVELESQNITFEYIPGI